ncbi:Trk system potassium transporter TrkA [Legionella dresdenensis]|uniref:Trk system potassium uptake protein TrkA n=1 Tax=Legionella dresdenensis TaxID=450200 RepID=A0ABV8CEA5_9GAMM
MRIVILGAGQVGGTLAENLVQENNDISLVDLNENRLKELHHRLDIQTVHGSASYPSVLIEAGIEHADMLIAVTDSDEINMIGCQVAYSLFRTPTKIARIRSQHYYNYPHLFHNDHVPVDVIISPEKLVATHIQSLITYPEATQIFDFADGKILLGTINTSPNDMMTGKSVEQLYQVLNGAEVRIMAVFRGDQSIEASPDVVIQPGDNVLFAATPKTLQQVLTASSQHSSQPNHRIFIAGGGHIGTSLAQALENNYQIKIVEHNNNRASSLASQLRKGTVLQGDIADRDLLLNENIEFADVFCAVTNDDEANIMSCLQAKRLGARHVMALINRPAYIELIDDSAIDQAISPQQITIGCILTKLRRGNMIKVQRLQNNEAEIIELVTHGNSHTSLVVGRSLAEIPLPPGCSAAAIIRNQRVIMATPNLLIESGDHVILLSLNRRYIRQIEALFQVSIAF